MFIAGIQESSWYTHVAHDTILASFWYSIIFSTSTSDLEYHFYMIENLYFSMLVLKIFLKIHFYYNHNRLYIGYVYVYSMGPIDL
jgi:hypothetical protein